MASPAASADALLQAGRAALKGRDYGGAVAPLLALVQSQQGTLAQRIQAEMALVQAYRGLGERQQAIAHCQHLSTYPHPQVQTWVRQQLATLTPAPDPSGVTPVGSATHSPAADPSGFTPPSDPANPSGFTPLGSPANAPVADPSGFTPLTDPADPSGFTPLAKPPPPPLPASPPPRKPLAASSPTNAPATPATLSVNSPIPPASPPEPTTAEIGPEIGSRINLEASSGINPGITPEVSPETTEATPAESPPWTMGQGERLDRPRPLPGSDPLGQLWAAMALTLGVGVALVDLLWHQAMASLNWALQYIDRVVPVPRPGWVHWDYTLWIVIGLGAIALTAPWILDWALGHSHGVTPLALNRLKTSHPEAAQLLRQSSQKQGWPLPQLYTLPLPEPLLFSYGWRPLPLRIVTSQGLLDALTGEELACLYARELAHLAQGTTPLFSLGAVLVGGSHQVYWQLATLGERITIAPLRAGLGLGAAIAYGFYWLGNKPALALARFRTLLADRRAIGQTGNPAALVRAWVKLAQGTAAALPQRGHTHPLLESLDALTPLGYRQALTLGTAGAGEVDLPSLLTWDAHNPHRPWLALNSAHPPLGYRIAQVNRLTRPWGLTPEIPLALATTRPAPLDWRWWQRLWPLASPYLGPLVGGAIALGLWVLGAVLGNVGLWQVQWLYGDRGVLLSSLYLGAGVGILLRLNRYFPDITQRNRRKQSPLATLLTAPETLPSDRVPLDLQGTLLGRPGLANWLCQDLWLHTPQGLFKLHYFSTFGPMGNLLLFPQHPSLWTGQTVQLLGWFRRGADPWVDVDRLIRSRKTQLQSQHPLWSVLLGLSICGMGLWMLLR